MYTIGQRYTDTLFFNMIPVFMKCLKPDFFSSLKLEITINQKKDIIIATHSCSVFMIFYTVERERERERERREREERESHLTLDL